MRIAMVSEHASPLAVLGGVDAGGQNVHVAELARALARRGAEVVVHTRRDATDLPREVELAPGVRVDHIDAGPAAVVPKDELLDHMDAFAEELEARWRAERPDVVHAHFWMSGHAALKAARAVGGIPVVQTFHALGVVKRRYQGGQDTSPPERLDLEREVARRADHIIATCTDEVFELLRLDAERARLTVIPCGADLSRFSPTAELPEAARAVVPPRREGVPRVVCVGRLVERKGVGTAISAMAHLPGAELVIAGGPAAEELGEDLEVARLRALAEAEGVADRVTFLGRVDRDATAAVMRSADVLVSVPWYEPFGIVPIEAMACGVPVVASAVGGMIDTVVDDRTGLHVPPRDPERLADALADLLADPARLERFGREGAERARQLWDWDRVGAATLDVYSRVAGSRRAREARGAGGRSAVVVPGAREHLAALRDALDALEDDIDRVQAWGERLAWTLADGGRLLAVGNGGSAAEAQHLTAELVGRFLTERRPLAAVCLHGDTSALTAIANDYGWEEAFARQVQAHGRPGDVLIALSTSGRSPNVLAAVSAAREAGLRTWGLTGPGPTPLAELCDDCLELDAPTTATVQELHLLAIHVLCGAVDAELAQRQAPAAAAAAARLDVRASARAARRRARSLA